jgi:hypothetical protein
LTAHTARSPYGRPVAAGSTNHTRCWGDTNGSDTGTGTGSGSGTGPQEEMLASIGTGTTWVNRPIPANWPHPQDEQGRRVKLLLELRRGDLV